MCLPSLITDKEDIVYTEKSVIDTINALDTGHILVRTSNSVLRDGVVIATTYHRHVLSPGDDLTTQDERVAAVAVASWTPDIVAAYEAAQAAGV